MQQGRAVVYRIALCAWCICISGYAASCETSDHTKSSFTSSSGTGTIWALAASPVQHDEVEACHMGPILEGTWSGYITPHAPHLQLRGTSWIQKDIWDHQHPADCSKARFLIYRGKHGIGAMVDLIAGALGIALDTGRILLLDFQDSWTVLSEQGLDYCKGLRSLDTCFFEPISSCTLGDVYGPGFTAAYNEAPDQNTLEKQREACDSEHVVFLDTFENKVPDRYKSFLEYPGVQLHEYVGGVRRDVYWYRSMAIAYIVRPNKRTLQELKRRMRHLFSGQSISPGTISVHVRHGDKKIEMRLMPDHEYVAAAEQMYANKGHLRLRKAIFLSTEDPATVVHFNRLTDWQIQYTNVTRFNHNMGAPFLVPAPAEEFLNSLLSLDLATQCDGFVCTLGSMWCTLIDRLRSTVRCKAASPYIDLHGTLGGLGHTS